MKDQIEMLTTERNMTPTVDARQVIARLPVVVQEQRNSLLDSVAGEYESQEPTAEGERLARFETALSWIAYGAVFVVAGLVTWSVGAHIMSYLNGGHY